jgi:translation initiation factor IF-2
MKVRIFQLARDLRISSDALVSMIQSLGVPDVKSHMSSVDEEVVAQIRARIAQTRESVRKEDERKQLIREGMEKSTKEKEEAARKPAPAAVPVAPVAVAPEPVLQPPPLPPPVRVPDAPAPWRPPVTTPPPQQVPQRGGPRGKRKKGRSAVDEKLIRETIKKTLAPVDMRRTPKRRRRRGEEGGAEGAEGTTTLKVTEFMTVAELASVMELNPAEVVGACIQLGIIANINRRLDRTEMGVVAAEFGYELEFEREYGEETLEKAAPTQEGTFDKVPRPPVVTVMGHVDHGKTSLLDHIRKTRVVASESGGITQHIGAYSVTLPHGRVAFLDTPGHEAFTAMRARGAQVTDIVILVVAADNRVMPQTLEAINHARAANVPIIVAITKIDLPEANPDRIKAELAEASVIVEQYGGKTVCVEVSSKTGQGIDQLLEMILLQAELLELKAEPDRPAAGAVIESRLDPGKGIIATVLVQNGTLRVQDPFVCGSQYGKVRAMVDDTSRRVKEAGPSTPVEVWGWSGLPAAGDTFHVTQTEQEARDISTKRTQIAREHELRLSRRRTLLDISQRIKQGEILGLNLVLKGDVAGSVEVLRDSLEKLSTQEVQVRVIHQGVGAITEGDVLLAAASDAIVVGFHVKPDAKAQAAMQSEKVDVRLYTVIYEIVDEVRSAMSGLLAPEMVEKATGAAEIRQVFRISHVGAIAGCMVTSGTIHRNDSVRLVRGGERVWQGRIASLKRIKDDAREVTAGFECGIGLEGHDDVRAGDMIETYVIEEVARKLE